ncbi:MAG: hypothetical protein IK041_05345 [Bacteroidales bacterium]|nr:hypothetical protein [Bacteroidales bacterium]
MAAFAVVLFVSSCVGRYKDIKITSLKLESVVPSSLKSVDAVVLVGVENPSRVKVKVKNMMGYVYQNSKQIATVKSEDEVELPPRCESQKRIKVRVTIDNAMFFFEQYQSGFRPNYKEFTVDLMADAGAGIFFFPVEKKGVSVEELVKQARSVYQK